MAEVMRELRQDHDNVGHLLDLLERELDGVGAIERGVDFELMRDIMLYMTYYPDRVHHPKEDLMFERVRDIVDDGGDVGAEVIDELLREHAALATKGEAFREMLERVVDGSMVEREQLESSGRDYVEFLRYHMRKEDERIFPLAEAVLGETDWTAVAEAFAAAQDPVFGPVVHREFEALFTHISRQEG